MRLLFLLLLFTFLSCKKEDDKSPLNELKQFEIKEMDVSFKIVNNIASAMVPSSTNLEDLTILFEVSEKAKVYVGDEIQESGVSRHDFSSALELIVEAENGNRNTYTVVVGKKPNTKPVANAGENQILYLLEGQTMVNVKLDGSASFDADGDIHAYYWKLGGNEIASGVEAEVALGVGTHTVVLTVEDILGDVDSDEATIDIREVGQYTPVDLGATQATKNLLMNLGKIADGPEFIFGQEFPMSFKLNSLRNDLSTSDSKEVTGDHPGVFGIDPHYILYKTASEAQLHIDEAKYAYNNGAVVTFDFHQQSKSDHKIYIKDITSASDKSLMYDVVNDLNNSRAWFFDELDQVIGIINNDLNFPVVWRLFHEMDGDWFWWGSAATNHSKQLYVDFYKLTADYIKDRTNFVLFAWSPNRNLDIQYYPGDAYVDIVGVDIYDADGSFVKQRLIELSDFSLNHNKIAALTEVGRNNFIANDPDFWSDTILKSIKDGGSSIKIAWVLGWFNAPWKSSQDDLFIPNSASNNSVKTDFINFKNDTQTLFLEDVKLLKMYDE